MAFWIAPISDERIVPYFNVDRSTVTFFEVARFWIAVVSSVR